MSKSLQEQLLGANLIDAKKAKKISKESRKTKNIQRRSKEDHTSEAKAAALKAQQEKQQRDNKLNQQKNAQAQKKAIAAQVKQMIEQFRIKRDGGEVEYNFTDGKQIKKIRIHNDIFEELARGRLSIAKLGDSYEIIPRPVAEKIRERDEAAIVVFNKTPLEQKQETPVDSDEEYYAQFEIPDDLDW